MLCSKVRETHRRQVTGRFRLLVVLLSGDFSVYLSSDTCLSIGWNNMFSMMMMVTRGLIAAVIGVALIVIDK